MKTKTYDIDGINNFHDRGAITVRITDTRRINGYDGRDYHPISRRVAARVKRHYCGHADCHCPAGGIIIDLNEDGDKGILAD